MFKGDFVVKPATQRQTSDVLFIDDPFTPASVTSMQSNRPSGSTLVFCCTYYITLASDLLYSYIWRCTFPSEKESNRN